MRQRTCWDWRLKLYPLIVIPAMVYLNVASQVPAYTSLKSGFVGEPAVATPFNAAPQESATSVHTPIRVVTDVVPAVAAPVQGVNSRGEAYVLERNP
jgi:hypothetical protein